MNRSVIRTFVMVALGVGLAVQGLVAQTPGAGNKGPNEAADKGRDATGGVVSRLNEALSLVSYARENESPIAMLTAVQMMRGVRAQDSAQRIGTKSDEAAGGAVAAPGKKGQTPAASMDAAALLNEAKGWAKGNPQVLALIDAELARPAAAPSSGTLAAEGGAVRHVDQVLPGRTDVYKIRFIGGQLAQVGVIGDGDTDLDLFVLDEFGNEIGRDDNLTDRCIVQWTPRWTGVYTVRIRNLGRVYNQYTLLSN